MENLLKGDWTSNDFIEARTIDNCKLRVSNSSKRSEHYITVQQKSPKVMKILIENENHSVQYSLEIFPRDLLVPLYKEASLIWLKLLFSKAIKGETSLNLFYITYSELKINSIFLSNSFTPSRNVNEEDSAAVVFEVSYELDGRNVVIRVQVPKIIEEGWNEGSAPVELEMWGEPSDLYQKNQRLQEMLLNLQQENEITVRQFQKSQQEIMNLKLDIQ
jgi:hypothetical protein